MGRIDEPASSPQAPQDQYNHNCDQVHEAPPDTYYTVENDDQPQVINLPPSPPPVTQQPQPVQFPPQSPQMVPTPGSYTPQAAKPQAYLPQQGQPQAYPPQQGQPQAYLPQKGQPQAYPPQQGQPQAYFPQQGQPQAYPPQQGQPQAYPPPHQAHPQAYAPPRAQMGYPGMPGTPNKPTPGFPVPQPAGIDGWSSDLFDCMDDPENAIITACFPCVTYGQVAEIVDNGQTSCATSGLLYGLIAFLIGCPCIISCSIRAKLRSRYGLAESPAPDWITHCFCEWCALCQEYRELKSRDLDPSIGWQGNLLKQQNIQMQQATMAPPMNQTMMG